MSNPNDLIRDSILRYLHNVHIHARGPKGVAIGIRDLHRAMKKLEIKQAEVNSNLDYLVQKGWAKAVVEKRTYRTAGGTTQESERITYKISDIGIDRLEGASIFERSEAFSRINITNIKGVTVIGEGNVVNTKFTDLWEILSAIEECVLKSERINEEGTLNVGADLNTIKSQLSKPNPNTTLIKQAWSTIEHVVTAAGFGELVAKAALLISQMV